MKPKVNSWWVWGAVCLLMSVWAIYQIATEGDVEFSILYFIGIPISWKWIIPEFFEEIWDSYPRWWLRFILSIGWPVAGLSTILFVFGAGAWYLLVFLIIEAGKYLKRRYPPQG